MEWRTPALMDALVAAGVQQREAEVNGKKVRLPVQTYLVLGGVGRWLLACVDPDDHDVAFGLCQLQGGNPELGYVRLSELAQLRNSSGTEVFEDPMFEKAARLDVFKYADMARITRQISLQLNV